MSMNINEFLKDPSVRKALMAGGAILSGVALFMGGVSVGGAPIAEKDRVIAEQTSRADKNADVASKCHDAASNAADAYDGLGSLFSNAGKVSSYQFERDLSTQKGMVDKAKKLNPACWDAYAGLKDSRS